MVAMDGAVLGPKQDPGVSSDLPLGLMGGRT